MSFVERFIILCPYLGESTIGGSLHLYTTSHITLYRSVDGKCGKIYKLAIGSYLEESTIQIFF